MARIQTALTDMLGVEHPILQAPMGSCAGGQLAAAVSNAGGFGMIGGAVGDTEKLKAEFAAAGNAKVGVGFITWMLEDQQDLFAAALDRSPAAVMLSFGDQTAYAPAVKAAGARLISQVQTVEMARQAVDAGADIIVAQGQEAGGHGISGLGVFSLVPAVIDAVGPEIPVVAAGGVAEGRGLAGALALGAAGVLVGSRFAATTESLWPAGKKSALLAATGADTVRTDVFDILRRGQPWPRPFDGRALRNETTDRWHGQEQDLYGDLPTEQAKFNDAEAADQAARSAVWAGEGVGAIEAVEPAGSLVERIVDEAARHLRGDGFRVLA